MLDGFTTPTLVRVISHEASLVSRVEGIDVDFGFDVILIRFHLA